ncbi:hypothetical protein A1D22_09515 [Pasteurellaceae bacterium LFhippo2]|nr:hypothetical protein [Pasteurellaceae bacterium LFhippo2]
MGLKMDRYDGASFFGSFMSIITGLTLSDWGVIMGIIFGLCTILMNWYYKDKEYKLHEKALQKYKIDLAREVNHNEQKH